MPPSVWTDAVATIRRRIDGPQDFHEQRGGITFRDTRTVPQQIREFLTTGFSAVVLVGLGAATVAVPATTTITLPAALAYAAYVLTRPVILPIRLPAYARGPDYGNPVPDPKREGAKIPGRPAGDWLIGWDEATGQQIWLSSRDMTMHGLIPGSTGAGKTQFIYSLLCNALGQGSGFTLVDGKAQNDLVFNVTAMARRWGREADVRVINLLVASGDRKSHTWNPFNSLNAEGLTELLLVLFLPQTTSGGDNKYFRDRATSLIRGMAHVFIWARDKFAIGLTAETLQIMFSDIDRLRLLSQDRIFSYYGDENDPVKELKLPTTFPREFLRPIDIYVRQTGAGAAAQDASARAKIVEQHNYVAGGFQNTLGQMTSTFGHVFGVNAGDLDLFDVLFNRRILVVLLPSLENSDETNAAIGKMVITALRYALAPALGSSVEGEYQEVVQNRPSTAKTPYPIVLDEVGQYATKGIDKIAALGRSLNVSLLLSFQELGTLYANLGRDLSVPLLGNPKLKIFLNLEDPGPTRQWVEEAGGTVPVAVLPGFDNSSPLGTYAEQQRADVREMKRISWSDIQSLDEGEAIVLFRGKRIYTRLFYAGVDSKIGGNEKSRVFPTFKRNRVLIAQDAEFDDLGRIRAHIVAGDDLVDEAEVEPKGEALLEIWDRLAILLEQPGSPRSDAQQLLGDLRRSAPRETSLVSIFAGRARPTAQLPRTTEPLHASIDRSLCEELVAFDVATGAEPQVARESVVHALNLFARGQEMRTS